jgi:hypothetical protein
MHFHAIPSHNVKKSPPLNVQSYSHHVAKVWCWKAAGLCMRTHTGEKDEESERR